MRVLLTGAGGFVGHHTLEHILTNTDWEVVCTDSFRHSGKVDRVAEILETRWQDSTSLVSDDSAVAWVINHESAWGDRVTVVTQDLTVPISDQTAHRIGHVDAIISMASESHVDRSIEFPDEFIRNNVSLILNLLEYHRKHVPDALFLQVSTDEVYGPAPDNHDHVEWETFYPSNPYSASKAAQESIAFSYWRTYGTPLILTNTMNIIGERQDPEKFMPMVIKKVLDGEPVTIHGSSGGKPGSRYYLHARNQADALVFLLKKYLSGDKAELEDPSSGHLTGLKYEAHFTRPPKYHIVGEREVDNLEMASLIADAVGKPLKYKMVDFHSSRPGHDLRYALDGAKMAVSGWEAPVPLEDSIVSTVEWTLAHREWLL